MDSMLLDHAYKYLEDTLCVQAEVQGGGAHTTASSSFRQIQISISSGSQYHSETKSPVPTILSPPALTRSISNCYVDARLPKSRLLMCTETSKDSYASVRSPVFLQATEVTSEVPESLPALCFKNLYFFAKKNILNHLDVQKAETVSYA